MSDLNQFSYQGYQEMVTDITLSLEETSQVMAALELDDQAAQARQAADRLKSHVFSVGILGEFKRGKSTVINAMLGEPIAPADVVPASATLNRITYGLKPKATIVYKDGHREDVPVDRIADYVTKITEDSAATAELVDQAVVEYPCQFCKNNVEIIDTPGLNDDDRMDAITESVIPTLDAVVLVLAAGSPFSKSEAEFVRNKLMTSDVTRMIVLVNRIDTIFDPDDRVRLLQSIREKITREILERTAAIHGKDSRLYQDTERKLGDVTLYPISAIQALYGRTRNKPEMVEQSGILDFEERLRKMLTQERGALEIARVANTITSLIAQGKEALEIRISALEMDTQQFLQNQREAEGKIQQLRQEKAEEKSRIRVMGREINRQMASIVAEKYVDLEGRLERYLDQYPVDLSSLDSEAAQQALQTQIREGLEQEVSCALSEYAEQINVFLQERIGDACVTVQDYMGGLTQQLKLVNSTLKQSAAAELAGVAGVDALSNLVAVTFTGVFSVGGFGLMGLGGLIEGYRAAGAKGAATGVLGGFAASSATALALVSALGVVPFIPFALITGVAGTLGGKLLSSLIWKNDIRQKKLDEFRSQLKGSVSDIMDAMKEQKLLENWAQTQVQEQVDALVARVEQETEAMLSGTEATLKAVAVEMDKASQNKDQRLEEYRQLGARLQAVSQRLMPILEKVAEAGA